MNSSKGFSGIGARKGLPLIDRLMARVIPEPNSGCWLWTGGMNGRGYGIAFMPGGRKALAHRAMLVASGRELSANDVVCHRCDVTCCVNPDHLFVGTQADNLHDMVKKGRHGKSYAIPPEWRVKIKDDTITPNHVIAWWFGVSVKTIRNIKSGAH